MSDIQMYVIAIGHSNRFLLSDRRYKDKTRMYFAGIMHTEVWQKARCMSKKLAIRVCNRINAIYFSDTCIKCYVIKLSDVVRR